MPRYIVTIDAPVRMRIDADDEDAAEAKGDALFASIYTDIEKILPEEAWLGERYDDTDVEVDSCDVEGPPGHLLCDRPWGHDGDHHFERYA